MTEENQTPDQPSRPRAILRGLLSVRGGLCALLVLVAASLVVGGMSLRRVRKLEAADAAQQGPRLGAWVDDIGGAQIKRGSTTYPKRKFINIAGGATVADDPAGNATDVTVTVDSASVAAPVSTFAALRALSTLDGTVVNGQSRRVGNDPTPWIYNSGSGAGFPSDDKLTEKPDDVLLGAAGRWYKATSAPTLPNIAALRLAVAGVHDSISVQAYSAISDEGGGTFDYDSSDTTSADNNCTIFVAGTRRYKRRYSGAISAAWCGGIVPKFFNAANGKWYTDAGLTTEASDDAIKVQRAINFANARGGGSVHIPKGDWYFKTKSTETTATHGEFVVMKSNVTVEGDGDASAIHVSPGWNTVLNGGYGAVIGLYDYTIHLDNVQWRNFRVDCNSKFNQFPASGYFGGVANPQNVAVGTWSGSNVVIDNIKVENHNGVFAILAGNYQLLSASVGVVITNNRLYHLWDDPNSDDASLISVGATNVTVTGNTVDYGGSDNLAWPSGNFGSGMEVHAVNGTISGNKVIGFANGLNIAGDSADAKNMVVTGNVFDNDINGITLYQAYGKKIVNLTISGNAINCRSGTVSTAGENGIIVARNTLTGWPTGQGIYDIKIHNNKIALKYGSGPTGGFGDSNGIRLQGNTGDSTYGGGVEIHDNDIRGFGTAGVFYDSDLTGPSNYHGDITIRNNRVKNSGLYGVIVSGYALEASPVFFNTHITDNEVTDDRGGGSTLQYGALLNGYADSRAVVRGNKVKGQTVLAEHINTATFTSNPKWANQPDLLSLDIRQFGAVEGASDSLAAINNAILAASTAGVRVVKVLGSYSVAGTIVGKAGVVLEGDSSASSTITELTAGSEVYLGTNTSDSGIRRLKIVSAGGANAVRFIALGGSVSHPLVEDCQISGFGSAGTAATVNTGTDVFTASGFSPVNGQAVQFSAIVGSFFNNPTFSNSTERVTITAHGLAANDPVVFNDYTTGYLPAPLVSLTTYYVKTLVDANNFTLSTTPGGAQIDITGTAGGSPIAVWGVIPAPLDPRLEYYVVNASGSTFKVAATVGGSAIDITGAPSSTLKVARVYGGVVLQANNFDMYSPRISRTTISGTQGDGGARAGVIVERVPTTTGTVVHATLDRNELGVLNKRGVTARNSEIHGEMNHIYNVFDGSGGAVGEYGDGAYSLHMRATRFESPAIDRLIYLTATTYGDVLEGTRSALSYHITDLGSNNDIQHGDSGAFVNTHAGFHTFNLLQDSISEKTASHGTVIGCGTFKTTDAAFSKQVNLDVGATPAVNQFGIKANGLGALSLINYSADNNALVFDADYVSGFKARHAAVAAVYKASSQLQIQGSTGNSVGSAAVLTVLANWDLSNGRLRLGDNAAGAEQLDIKGRAYMQNGTQPSTPSGGGVIYVADGSGGTVAGQLRYRGPSGTDTILAAPFHSEADNDNAVPWKHAAGDVFSP